MTYNTLLYDVDDYILTLTLSRPDKLNAFTTEMAGELVHAFARASEDDDARAIVVTGAGRAFCAGMDLSVHGNVFGLDENFKPTAKDMHERLEDPEIIEKVRDSGGKVTLAIYDCKKPVIAAINGAAVGIGATMTCAMDFRLASTKARIGFVFNKIGIVPEACSSWFLPRLVGMQTALEWCYTGDILDADTAHESGLVKAVYEPENLLEEAYALARKFTSHSPVAIAITRQMLYRNAAQPHPIEAHKIDSLGVFYTSQIGASEGIKAFLEKRKPTYTDKASEMPPFYPWWT